MSGLTGKQYAVDPPSRETAATLREEQTVSEAVNSVVAALQKLNSAFAWMAASLGLVSPQALWGGSLDSLAGRQLKWVYPATADDDEFLKRATLASTLVFEALEPKLLRNLLDTIGQGLHLNSENPPRSLGSRNLLQRLTLVALLIGDLRPKFEEIPMLVNQAEGKLADTSDPDLKDELARLNQRIRDDFAPLALLYDLRISGGLTHAPNKTKTSIALARLCLPKENWHRTHHLQLLNLVVDSVRRISAHLDTAAYELEMQEGR